MSGPYYGQSYAYDCGCIAAPHYNTNSVYQGDKVIILCRAHSHEQSPPVPEPDATNPKDLVGEKKVSISKLPAVAMLHAAHAMMNGAVKFGPYNWREKKVQAEIYIDAALRHITLWNEREETATDSGVHHLGHAMACLAILLDAQESGNLIDNRPPSNGSFSQAMNRLNETVAKAAK